MNIELRKKRIEELRRIIQRGEKTHKILRQKEDEVCTELYRIRESKDNVYNLIQLCKREIGRRKSKNCKALGEKKDEWTSWHICKARRSSWNARYSKEELFRRYCCECKWTPSQITTRIVMLKIEGDKVE